MRAGGVGGVARGGMRLRPVAMRTLSRSRIELSQIMQLLAGVGVFLLGAWMWLQISFRAAAINAKPDFSLDAEILLTLLLPGLLVAVGSFLQTVCDQRWALIMVVIGAVSAALIAVTAFFVFGYLGDASGKIAAFADFLLILLTTPLAFRHAFLQERPSHG